MSKSVVLLSSGLDSTVNFFEAVTKSQVVLGLTFDYGQRAASKEIAAAKKICALKNVPHRVVELPFFKIWGGSSLTDASKEVPTGREVSIDDREVSRKTAKSVWVPNRNGVFLNIAAGFAESLGAQWIIPGFNAEEAATFPDNTGEFLEQTTAALKFSTANHVEARCFTTTLNKTQIVRRGLELGVDFRLMWPCYFSGENWCGECESCQRSKRALESAGLSWEKLTGDIGVGGGS
jgi:7-cyano-7-deazaguanine synthase